MKTLRKDILALIQTYIEKEEDFTYFNQNFLPTLQAMIEDFSQSDPNARDSETLMLFAIILKKEGQHLENFLNPILIQLCQPTLQMIMNDLISFPEFREGFFKLV
jgi:exportin-1